MVNNLYKAKMTALMEQVKKKGAIKSYAQFCKTKEGKETKKKKKEIMYYTSKIKGN